MKNKKITTMLPVVYHPPKSGSIDMGQLQSQMRLLAPNSH